MRLALLALLLSPVLAAQQSGIDGLVVNRATGEPVSGVHIRLIPGDLWRLGATTDYLYGAVSDKAGRFSVSGVKPGVYFLMPERTGFVPVKTGLASTVEIKTGQTVTQQRIEMDRRALILGRVLDEYGDPVQGVTVSVQAVAPATDLDPILGLPLRLETDDHGEFRLVQRPGRYYIVAMPAKPDSDEPQEVRADGTEVESYDITYYPSAGSTRTASVVDAAPGQEIPGIEIHLRRTAPAGPGFTVSGAVSGAPQGAHSNVSFRYGPSFEQLYYARYAETTPDGAFTLSGLEPGAYRLFARYLTGKAGLQSPAVDFQLDGDRANVQLNLRTGDALDGTVEFAGGGRAGVPAAGRTVMLIPYAAYYDGAERPEAHTEKSGAFHFDNIHPGQFRVTVDPMPENAYLKAVALDDATAPDAILDFSRGVNGSRLKITVSLDGAQVSGKILRQDGEPWANALADVMLWKEDEQVRPGYSRLVESGAYSIQGLLPGKYRVAAIDDLDAPRFSDPHEVADAFKAYRALAHEIELKAGDRLVLDLKAIGKGDLHATPKQ